MKRIVYLLSVLILGSSVLLSGCGDKDKDSETPELSDQQKAAKTLSSGVWGGQGKVSVTPPNSEITEAIYEDLLDVAFTFDANEDYEPSSFSSTGGGDFFPDLSTEWSWSGSGTSTIALSNDQISQLTNVQLQPSIENATSLTFTFNYSGETSGKAKDVSGNYTVTMQK